MTDAPAERLDSRPFAVESHGLDVIAESERKGSPRSLFWPWFAANVGLLGLSYGSFALGFGISFWQAVIAGVLGIVFSFLLCGFIAVGGKRVSAPTMVLSRAAYGVRGNRLPAVISWVLDVGWETVLMALATMATATVFGRLGWGGGTSTEVIALIVVGALTVAGGVMGFDLIMRLQAVITVVTGVLTVVYMILVVGHIHWDKVSAIHSGNAAGDYSRYLPRKSSNRAIVGWTTFGGSLAPLLLLVFGLLLAGSSASLNTAIAADPIGALTTILPTWFLVPFAIVAILGMVGGAVLDIYSSGLSLLAAGVRIPRYAAAGIDGVLMTAGAIYIVFVSTSFIGQFEGFLITLGVPISAWCGVILADLALRRRGYDEHDLFSVRGRYGDIRILPIATTVVGTVVGWGLVTNTYAGWLDWQGYLLGPFGLGGKSGSWAYANLGVLAALGLGFVVTFAQSRGRIRVQEERPETSALIAGEEVVQA